VPQLSTTTPDAMWGDFSEYAGEAISRLGEVEAIGAGSGSGFGSGHGHAGGSHRTKSPQVRMGKTHTASELLYVGDLAADAGVLPPADRATSVFRVAQPLDLPPQHSAMVPFVNAQIAANPIAWFSDFESSAERAVGVSNSIASTLPGGPVSVFGDGGFLGEAVLEQLKPGARQFARIGDETDIDLEYDHTKPVDLRHHVDFASGHLRTHFIRTSKTRLRFENRSGRKRDAYVGLPVVLNASIEGSDRIDYETTSGTAFAVFELSPTGRRPHDIVTRQALSEGVSVDALQEDAMSELIADASLPAAERDILTRGLTELRTRAASRRKKKELDIEVEALEKELERLREHANSLSGSGSKSGSGGDALTALVTRILERDARLSKLQSDQRALEKELDARDSAIVQVLEEFEPLRPAIVQARDQAKRQKS
jgi:hypothetical protein